MEEHVERPPLGLRPKYIHTKCRISEIGAAIERYMEAGYPIPVEWMTEYNELIKKLPIEEKEFMESMKSSANQPE